MRKIIWLLVNNIQVTISVTLQYFTWLMKGQGTSTLLDENLTCEFKRKYSFTLSKSCMKTERFLLPVKNSLFFTIWIEERDPKAKENLPVVLMRPSLRLVFEWLKTSVPCQPTQVALTKMPRSEAKIYQETDFVSNEGHLSLLTSSGFFLAWTSSLDVIQVRFAFVAFCLWTILPKLCSFAKVDWLHLSSSKLRRGKFLGRLVGPFFAFCFLVLTEF